MKRRHPWFKARHYKHFDVQVDAKFADGDASNPAFVATHDWLPLIHYVKREKRYKPKDGRTVYKDRDIMYASHRDACILGRYANCLSNSLEEYYSMYGLREHVIAYRKLGKSNYAFSADAYRFSQLNSPCIVLCFDITGFFDHLDHSIIKDRLKRVLGLNELPVDWYKVFRHVTNFKKIARADLATHPVFGPRLKLMTHAPIATIADIKRAGVPIIVNSNKYGIPQGTPISSAISNLYMIDLDSRMSHICGQRGALYQRYSDDILIVCRPEHEAYITAELNAAVDLHKLEIKPEKTERVEFDPAKPKAFQYLGFNVSPNGATIRHNSLGRQWRKFKRGIRKARRDGELAIREGRAVEIYTKKLRKKFSPVGIRNFSAYARNAAKAFGSKQIIEQVRRLERKADEAIRQLK